MSDALEDFHVIDMTDHERSGSGGSRARFHDPATAAAAFGFRQAPFADSVDPAFFFRTEAHERAFALMRRAIDEHLALALTVAPSGTGKTLISQILLSELDPARHEPILVLAYPGMSRVGLLREVAGELGVTDLGPRAPLHQVMAAVQDAIVALHRRGRKLVVIVDECHFLGVEPLQMVRTLSNIELPERKLVTLLLFGEDSFLAKMDRPEYASLFNRMFIRARLRALDADETKQYVKFRCLVSGGRPNLFDDTFLAALHERSKGIPREINRLCHAAMAEAAGAGAKAVGPEHLPDM